MHGDQRDLGEEGARAHAAVLTQVFERTVLDAGGGSGRVSVILKALDASPLLLDLSADMLAAARDRCPRVRADLASLSLADASVDGVHAAYAIQNVPRRRTAVRELVRVVRPGGALPPTVQGSQARSARQRVERTADNPSQSSPPEPARRTAINKTLRWAGNWSDVDAPQRVRLAHECRLHRLNPQDLRGTRVTKPIVSR